MLLLRSLTTEHDLTMAELFILVQEGAEWRGLVKKAINVCLLKLQENLYQIYEC